MTTWRVIEGDCIEAMAAMDEASVDAIVTDPFTGSGSTGIAAMREGFAFVGIEREADYAEIARDRIRGDAPMFNVPAEVA